MIKIKDSDLLIMMIQYNLINIKSLMIKIKSINMQAI